jgi:hypothetical protein
MFTASLAGNCQIAAVTALVLPVPSIPFMLLIERFLNAEMLARVARSQFDRSAGARRFDGSIGERERPDPFFGTDQRRGAL